MNDMHTRYVRVTDWVWLDFAGCFDLRQSVVTILTIAPTHCFDLVVLASMHGTFCSDRLLIQSKLNLV
jgi:hypothetical protein